MTIRSVVRRDLDLSGEFRVLPESVAEDLYFSKGKVDVKAWKKKGAESVVRVRGRSLPNGEIELLGEAYFTDVGNKPVFQKRMKTHSGGVRAASHRIADALIGALTGTPGAFSSELTFILQTGKTRRVYVIDGDGHNPRPASTDEQLALSPAFGPDHRLYYSASVHHDAFKVFAAGEAKPLQLSPRGSVYGLAFSRKRDEVAISIARGATIKLFRGPNLYDLKPASSVGMAMHPAFSPTGKLAFAGAGKWGQRIYVGRKAVSPAGLNASAPVFCRHPTGVRLVYAVGVGKNTDLVASNELGGRLVRLTQSRGRNNYPACSPDGRLIAFFSTRKSDEGPGLYIMRIDGRRPKRISTLVGDSLRWARLPPRSRLAKAAPGSKTKLTAAKAGDRPMKLKVKPKAKSAPKPDDKSAPKSDDKSAPKSDDKSAPKSNATT
ncbi:MAG: tolB protein [Polyangiaceae bacterium]